MAVDQTANFVRINVAGTHTDTDTTIQLESGAASELPDPANGEYNLTWWDDTFADHPSDDDNVEIVRVTGVDTGNDTITVQRGREGTTAVSHDNSQAQYRMVLSATAGLFDQFEDVTNLDGSAGGSGQFLQTDGNNTTFSDISTADIVDLPALVENLTLNEYRSWQNQIARNIAELDFAQGLAELGYPDGFFDGFFDQSKIASSSNIDLTTGQNGNLTLSLNSGSTTSSGENTSSYATNPPLSLELTASSKGFLETFRAYFSSTDSRQWTISIISQDSETLASKTVTSDGNIPNISFSLSDYIRPIEAGETVTVKLEGNESHRTSGTNSKDFGVFSTSGELGYNNINFTELSFASSGSVTSTDNNLGYQGQKLTLTAVYDLPTNTDLNFDLLDGSDNVITTVSESEIGNTISISTSDTVYAVRANLSTSDGVNTPTLEKYEVGIDDAE